MDLPIQREASLKILTNNISSFNLYSHFNKYIFNYSDFIDISSFLEPYSARHNVSYYDINLATGVFKKNNILLTPLIKGLLKLNPFQFEKVSAVICKCFGFTDYFATKQTRDHGLDVLAFSNHFNNLYQLNIGFKHYIIGQSKKFKKNPADVDDIKNLFASIELFRRGILPVKDKSKVYSGFKIKQFTTLHAIFTTSYFFTNDALEICNQMDVIPIDIIDLAFILLKGIDRKVLDWKLNNGKFNRTNFLKEINNIKITK